MNSRPQVVITDLLQDDLAPERAVLGELADVVALNAQCEADLRGRVEQAQALIVYHLVSVTAPLIERLEACRIIVRGGVGFDNVDGPAARRRGIPLANVPDYGTEEVADTALGLMLALTRGIQRADSRLHAGDEWSYTVATPLVRLRGRVLGIIGLGRIGTAMALRGKALGMDVAFYDPYKPDGFEKALGVRRAESLAELLGQALVVSVHCPLNAETRHLINAQTIAAMPRDSYLVNTARGGIVDASAVPPALRSGHLAGAALDVLEQEPPSDHDPLLVAWRDSQHPARHRLILNPHLAWYSVDGQLELRRKTAEACRRALLGLPLRNVVN